MEKRTACITGAAGVLGKAVAKGLTDEGMRIALLDLHQGRLDEVQSELGSDAYTVACDISNPEEVEEAIRRMTAGTAYSTSKGALVALTFSLAAETASFGITVNGIAPAYVKTPMVTDQLTESQRQQLIEKIPVHRFCEPEEFVHVVKFLVHPLAGFITGEIVDQNGGLHFD